MRHHFKSRKALWLTAVVFCLSLSARGSEPGTEYTVAEPFSCHVLATGLEEPWEMLWGPDGKLWITERKGLRVIRMDPDSGEKTTVVSLPEAHFGFGQDGVLGMAFAPGFLRPDGENYLYVYYTHKDPNAERLWGRLARFTYDVQSDALTDQRTVIDGLPAGGDHNSGRLRFGPDGMLYLTVGDMGKNQGKSFCVPIEAQRIPTQEELDAKNWVAYQGKSLRIRPDGGIPADNPVINGIRSHVFTYGHRNPQGLCFVGDMLYSCEHGPSSDDELNLLESGGNYGWPHVAGFQDNMGYVYANYSAAAGCPDVAFDPNVIPDGVPVQQELDWSSPDFRPPVKSFHTVPTGYNYLDSKCGKDMAFLCWPTIAPSGVTYYPADGAIPTWRGSLLMTTLKSGALYRLPLSGDQKQVQGDYEKIFRSRNRYRVACTDPEGGRIFIACDAGGAARDINGKPAGSVRDPGSILVFTYKPE